MNILDKIVADKRIEVQRHKEAYTVDMLLGSEQMMRSTVSLSRALSESSSGIIAEFKRRSPSKGWIHRDADVERVVLDYQIYQAKAIGADAVLLIAAVLDRKTCRRFTDLAHSLGMEVLLELHEEKELDYLDTGADMIGVNNRDLTTFETRVEHSFDMVRYLPSDKICISESGISSPDTVRALRRVGFRGFLMGENFMKEVRPGAALSWFVKQLNGGEDVG